MLTYDPDYLRSMLALILVSGAVLTVPTSMLLLRLFRRSVQKGMTAISQEEANSVYVDTRAASSPRACGPCTPLTVRVLNDGLSREVEAEGYAINPANRADLFPCRVRLRRYVRAGPLVTTGSWND